MRVSISFKLKWSFHEHSILLNTRDRIRRISLQIRQPKNKEFESRKASLIAIISDLLDTLMPMDYGSQEYIVTFTVNEVITLVLNIASNSPTSIEHEETKRRWSSLSLDVYQMHASPERYWIMS